MNCYSGKDLARAYRTVRDNTLKIAEEIPESKYDFSPAPGVRITAACLRPSSSRSTFSAPAAHESAQALRPRL